MCLKKQDLVLICKYILILRMSEAPNMAVGDSNALPSRGPVMESVKPPSRGLSRSHSRSNRPSSGNRPPSGNRPSSAGYFQFLAHHKDSANVSF